MTDNKWHSGPPPSLGWWPASTNRFKNIYRWWNGEYWSGGVWEFVGSVDAANRAKFQEISCTPIKWKHRPANWPLRSLT